MTYEIFYRRPYYDRRRTYFQNYDRHIAWRVVTGEAALHEAVAEITAAGFPITNIYNEAGRKVRV